MTPKERYLKVKEVFLYVAKLAKAEQEKYLEEVSKQDLSLKEEVEGLLLAETEKISFELDPKKSLSFQPFVEHQYISPGILINNRYKIESELARGGFSAIYLAKDLQLNSRSVVVKVMLGVINSSQNWQESKFFAEIKALSKINHPNVVAIYDYGLLSNSKPFFVMELVLGVTLRELISKARMGLEIDQALRIIKQIGNALTAVHELGIYHRDLKPENIMVRSLDQEQEHVEVIDFGIATVKESSSTGNSTVVSSVAGTPAYMAPEQLDGKPSASSDIYALGVIAYELLTGRPPFNIAQYKNLREILSKLRRLQQQTVIAKPSELNPNFSSTVDQVLFKALSYDPRNRYTKSSDFVKALSSALVEVVEENIYWEKLCSMAKTTSNIWFINERMRKKVNYEGTEIVYEDATNIHSLNSQLSMVLALDKAGYLLLMAKESKKDVICLCPSRYVANDELSIYPVLLPTEGLVYKYFPLSLTKGRKQVVAVISQTPIDLAWPKATLAAPTQTLTAADICALINKLERIPTCTWSAFYSYVDII